MQTLLMEPARKVVGWCVLALLVLSFGCSDAESMSTWEPGDRREESCGVYPSVSWTPWFQGWWAAQEPGGLPVIGCLERPLVEFFDSEEQLLSRADELGIRWGADPVEIDYSTQQAVIVANFCDVSGQMLEVDCLSENGPSELLMGLTMWWGQPVGMAESGHVTVLSMERQEYGHVDVVFTENDGVPPYDWFYE